MRIVPVHHVRWGRGCALACARARDVEATGRAPRAASRALAVSGHFLCSVDSEAPGPCAHVRDA